MVAGTWLTSKVVVPSGFSVGGFASLKVSVNDSAQGPNGTYAVGRWSDNERKGAYSGFTLPAVDAVKSGTL